MRAVTRNNKRSKRAQELRLRFRWLQQATQDAVTLHAYVTDECRISIYLHRHDPNRLLDLRYRHSNMSSPLPDTLHPTCTDAQALHAVQCCARQCPLCPRQSIAQADAVSSAQPPRKLCLSLGQELYP